MRILPWWDCETLRNFSIKRQSKGSHTNKLNCLNMTISFILKAVRVVCLLSFLCPWNNLVPSCQLVLKINFDGGGVCYLCLQRNELRDTELLPYVVIHKTCPSQLILKFPGRHLVGSGLSQWDALSLTFPLYFWQKDTSIQFHSCLASWFGLSWNGIDLQQRALQPGLCVPLGRPWSQE